MNKKSRRRIPPMSKPAPKPKKVALPLTKEQVGGLVERENAIRSAMVARDQFVSGIITGHGYSSVNVSGFNAEKMTMTVTPNPD